MDAVLIMQELLMSLTLRDSHGIIPSPLLGGDGEAVTGQDVILVNVTE